MQKKFIWILLMLTIVFLASCTTESNLNGSKAEYLSYDEFVLIVERYQQEFKPEGFELIYPQGEVLPRSTVGFIKTSLDESGINAFEGDPSMPKEYYLYYHYPETDVLVELAFIYAPYFKNEEDGFIYYSVYRSSLTVPFEAEYQEMFNLPRITQILYGAEGFFLRMSLMPSEINANAAEASPRVAEATHKFLRELAIFID